LRKFDILSEARIDKVERPSNFANQKTLPFFSCFLTSLSHGKKTREGWGAIEMGLVGWYWRRVKLGESREGPAWFFFFVEETSFFSMRKQRRRWRRKLGWSMGHGVLLPTKKRETCL
jgi:hypothetical protein